MKIAFCLLILSAPVAWPQNAPSPEEASAKISQNFRELTSNTLGETLRDSIGSYQQMVKDRQRRDLMPRTTASASDPAAGRFNLGRNAAMDPLYRQSLRFNSESVDINLVRPSPRWTIGVGVAERSMNDHGVTIYDRVEKYGFIKFQLSGPRDERKKRVIWLPTATYTETELGPNKVRVDREEHDRGLKELKP